MEIKQFYDTNLAHASYAVLSENQIALIDPARDPEQYYKFAKENNAVITAVIETHPHADFVSSHLEISKSTGAGIYVSRLLNPYYKFVPFDEGDELKIGSVFLIPLNTPGHSPDSISVIIRDEDGKDHAIATGDTLFVGDVGRPDLREKAGSISKSRTDLAKMMYSTINEKLLKLPENILVYPAHGAGSLCGKATSTDTFSTIGREKKDNYALQPMTEDTFVNVLLKDQPFIPKYFEYDVELNRRGAPDFEESINNVRRIITYNEIENGFIVIDTRSKADFDNGHFKGAVNLGDDRQFETWLGTIVSPLERYYLVSDTEFNLDNFIKRTAKIGYELLIEGALVHKNSEGLIISDSLDINIFMSDTDKFTLIDVRNKTERENRNVFSNSLFIPLNELRERFSEIPAGKPVVVHCAAGYRSAAAASILRNLLDCKIYDLGEDVKIF
ncbi:MAG: MBL fold metallo-hydrolase [Ignavibacteria bacterium]|nr:MBL fold metallo-hydrolase [Ignavibacteria bacterium]